MLLIGKIFLAINYMISCAAVGDVLAGLLFGILGNFASRRRPGRDTVLLIGYVAHMVAFYLIFVTFPADSPLKESHMMPYFTPRLSSSHNIHRIRILLLVVSFSS